MENMTDEKEPDLDDAVRAIRAWYYSAIRSLADDAIQACVGYPVCADPADEMVRRDALAEGRTEAAAEILRTSPTVRKGRERDAGQDPREFLTEWVDQATDDHAIVIYTFKAKCALLASDNEDAYEDEIGEKAPTVEAAACMAMRRDVWELLDARSDEWEECEAGDEESEDE